jgi:hypothetical protein
MPRVTFFRRLLPLLFVLAALPVLAQNPKLTNPGKPAQPKFDPKQPIPKLLVNCWLSDGKPRKYPCEFAVEELTVVGSPQPPLKYPAWGKKGMGLTLYLSKAKSKKDIQDGSKTLHAYTFELRFRFRRINSAVKPVGSYVLTVMPLWKEASTKTLGDFPTITGPTKPNDWPAAAEPALTMPVGSTQDVTAGFTVFIDPFSASGTPVFRPYPNPWEGTTLTMDLRVFLNNMATTYALNTEGGFPYSELRDFAEWSARFELIALP